jgi:hypothetical protein
MVGRIAMLRELPIKKALIQRLDEVVNNHSLMFIGQKIAKMRGK